MLQHKGVKVGIEMSHSFGDALFAIPLIRAISEKHQCKVILATNPKHSDAFLNLPFIHSVIHINHINEGMATFKNQSYEVMYQITPQYHWGAFKAIDQENSLIDVASYIGSRYNIAKFDQRPIFNPTAEELSIADKHITDIKMPIIAIESVANSGQSWMDQQAIDVIVNAHYKTHRILWLSNRNAPQAPYVDDLLKYTRRQIICMLKYVDIMYTTGSGFFCASLALPRDRQPKKIICLWIDDAYKYERRLANLQWHEDLRWVHDHNELLKAIER